MKSGISAEFGDNPQWVVEWGFSRNELDLLLGPAACHFPYVSRLVIPLGPAAIAGIRNLARRALWIGVAQLLITHTNNFMLHQTTRRIYRCKHHPTAYQSMLTAIGEAVAVCLS